MRIYSISKDDTNIIKGIGILLIVLHNFFHWISPSPGENEFNFSPERIFYFFKELYAYPGEVINILFSYFGHFGVQLFLFISGYGMTLSLLKKNMSWGGFLVTRLKKLYPLLFTGIVVFFVYTRLVDGIYLSKYAWQELSYKTLFVHTLLPKSGMGHIGPWWFFGLIFQLYVFFPFLLKIMQKYQWKGFLGICILAYGTVLISQFEFKELSEVPFLENAPGHLPEFCLGIYFALNKDKNLHFFWLIGAILIFILGNFFHIMYPLTFLSITTIFVFSYPSIKNGCERFPRSIKPILLHVGSISMLLFATHTPIRNSLAQFYNTSSGAMMHLLGAIIYLIAIYCIALISKLLYKALVKLFSYIPTPTNTKNTLFEKIFFSAFCAFYAYVICFYVLSVKPLHTPEAAQPSTYCEQDTIDITNDYFVLARYDINDNPRSIDMQVEFDYESFSDEYPAVVFDISGLLWNDYSMGGEPNTGTKHYTYKYKFIRPVLKRVKGKQLSVILRTKNEVHGEIKNVNIVVKK